MNSPVNVYSLQCLTVDWGAWTPGPGQRSGPGNSSSFTVLQLSLHVGNNDSVMSIANKGRGMGVEFCIHKELNFLFTIENFLVIKIDIT